MLKLEGIAHQTALFLQKAQLSDAAQWAKFVDVYRSQPDGVNRGWRGEFWGKMMRGGALVCAYTQNDSLYTILTDSVRDMLTVMEDDGRVSSYSRETEFDSWDLWSRKYVMLGCQYYLEICRDEGLKKEIIRFLCRLADYILAHIGPGKKKITDASRNWCGINSSSILEPMVRLYKLTGEQRYLEFAAYIVENGGAKGINIFELAYENRLYPYQYGVSKAYELTSCFEGLLEYYSVTGVEKYKTAAVNFARAVLDSEVSIIGSCGITHELFDHSKARQTVRYDGVMQETCVTVTWMKFCARILALTGDSVFADSMERSFYNAYLGAINFERKESQYIRTRYGDKDIASTYLPFDSYSPLTVGTRGRTVGGHQILPDKSYYGCCACIGSAGVGIFLQNAVTADESGITVNFFETGTAELTCGDAKVSLFMQTGYPVEGKISIRVQTDRSAEFTLKIRNPGWAEGPGGYLHYTRLWQDDTLELEFAMPVQLHYPDYWEEDTVYTDTSKNSSAFHGAFPKKVCHQEEEDHYVAVTRGPLTLAADGRTGKAADSVFVPTRAAAVCESTIAEGIPCLLKLKFTPVEGEEYSLVDYGSAGRDWQTPIAAWLPTK